MAVIFITTCLNLIVETKSLALKREKGLHTSIYTHDDHQPWPVLLLKEMCKDEQLHKCQTAQEDGVR